MNSCYNRPPLEREYIAFDGYRGESRQVPRPVVVAHTMTTDCQYTKTTHDPRCSGCIHENKPDVDSAPAAPAA